MTVTFRPTDNEEQFMGSIEEIFASVADILAGLGLGSSDVPE
ncbi:hypothetical protein [Rhodococcus gannanensis]|uniref:Uncharacterized protein n=1 Tax=Rhodococcus gannanensis TaxID=1960308 RepID=A0ABW4P394_9NOCA